jgi:hypothetical protein
MHRFPFVLPHAFLSLSFLFAGCSQDAAVRAQLPDFPTGRAAAGFGTPGALGGAGASEVAAAAATAALPAGAPTLTADISPDAARQIIYTAALALTVPDIAAAQSSVRQAAASLGGYLEEINGPVITIRVPAGKFDDARTIIERLGVVTDRQVKAADVTEEMHDLHLRLDNALQTRTRLTELLAKSTRVEDTLKIEQELTRVTEAVELLKGKLQFMDSQAAFSTLRAAFNSPRPQNASTDPLPFRWVRDLASGAVGGNTESNPDTSRLFHRNDRFKLPPGFVRYYEREHVTEAMSADNVVIKLVRQDNYDGGSLDFWSTLAKKTLLENRAIAITDQHDVTLSDKSTARVLIGAKDTGGPKQTYLLGLVATSRYVYTFEAWGPSEAVASQRDALEKALTTLDAKHW